MTKQTMARLHKDDVRDMLRECVGADVEVKTTDPCKCCNAVIGYARDHRALWVLPQLWPTTLPPDLDHQLPEAFIEEALLYEIRVVGFETNEELDGFLRGLQNKTDYEAFAETLRNAFAGGAN